MISKIKAIKTAIVAVALIAAGLYVYSWLSGVPAFHFFESKDKMEPTATQLTSIQNLHQWVFLTIEGEEVVVLERGFLSENVCKVFRGSYDLGINLNDSSTEWFTITESDGKKTAHLTLPPITLLDGGIRDTEVYNVYGSANSKEKWKMKQDAATQLKYRALSPNNIRQAEKNAERHFKSLFRALGCDEVTIEWEKWHFSPR